MNFVVVSKASTVTEHYCTFMGTDPRISLAADDICTFF